MTKFEPFGERLVVKIVQETEKTESGLVLNETPKELSNKGVVEELGPDVKDYLKKGDTVLFNKGAGILYESEYRVLHERDVLGKITEV